MITHTTVYAVALICGMDGVAIAQALEDNDVAPTGRVLLSKDTEGDNAVAVPTYPIAVFVEIITWMVKHGRTPHRHLDTITRIYERLK